MNWPSFSGKAGPGRRAPLFAQTWRAEIRAIAGGRRPRSLALLYFLAVAVAESATVLWEPRLGLVLHLLLLAGLLIHSALLWNRPLHRLLLTLTFAPLIRVVSLSLPLAGYPLIYWYLITSVPLFVAALFLIRHLHLPWQRWLQPGRRWPLQLAVGCLGLFLGVVEFYILRPDPLADSLSWIALLLPALTLIISTGFLEELVFRGIIQHAAVGYLGPPAGVMYVALLFAIMHLGYHSLADLAFVLIAGLAFGLIVFKTGTILGVSLAHGLTNVVLFLIMPFVAAPGPVPDISEETRLVSIPAARDQASSPGRAADPTPLADLPRLQAGSENVAGPSASYPASGYNEPSTRLDRGQPELISPEAALPNTVSERDRPAAPFSEDQTGLQDQEDLFSFQNVGLLLLPFFIGYLLVLLAHVLPNPRRH